MMRRALSVATCAASPNSNSSSPQSAVATPLPLAPRPDVDLTEQRRLVAQERAENRAKQLKVDRGNSLYGCLAPQEEARVMEFNRHSLRLLVLEAHNRQVVQSQRVHDQHHHHVDPMSAAAAMSESSSSSPTSRGNITPPPDGHFDLSKTHNFNALLQDIDTLMAVAQAKPPQTRDRILNQTYEQLARLSLWSDLQ